MNEEKKLPEENDEQGDDVPNGEERSDEGSVRKPEAQDDNGEDSPAQQDTRTEGETIEQYLLRIGHITLSDLQSALKKCYKHAKSGGIPVVVNIQGDDRWFPITGCETIQNKGDDSQAVVVKLMHMPESKPEPKFKVFKNLPKDMN